MRKFGAAVFLGLAIMAASTAHAHSPICDCYDNGDTTITCEGGFSDGSSAAGVSVIVYDASAMCWLSAP